uniref:Uncharacterized protein n=1 Tax=Strigamia maritima TaxID=126957 RepID=T1J5I0_STRMM
MGASYLVIGSAVEVNETKLVSPAHSLMFCSRFAANATMSIEQLRHDIEASLQRTALILNEDTMQRHPVSYHPAPMDKPSKSGTFNTVRLKKYFGIGSKKSKSVDQLHYRPPTYPDVVQAQYPRYPEGWMYTTVTSKTVHTVYAASMRGSAPRERPPMYAWDGYPTTMNVDARYPDMCICHRPPAPASTWSRRPARVQCTCCEASSPPPLRRDSPGSKFSTLSNASIKSGPKRKSILESGVTAYDLIAKSESIKKSGGSLDDSLIDDFVHQSEEKEKVNENQNKVVSIRNKPDSINRPMFIKNKIKSNQMKNSKLFSRLD